MQLKKSNSIVYSVLILLTITMSTIGAVLLPESILSTGEGADHEQHEQLVMGLQDFSGARDGESVILPNRYIVFLPGGGMEYPWPEQVLYRYKLLPAILVKSSTEKLFNWLKKVPEAKAYPDMSYMQDFATMEEQTSSSAGVDTRDTVKAQAFYTAGINGTGVRIGIIDTGIYRDHVELAGKVVAEKSFVNTTFGYSEDVIETDDIDGHGTQVAGIAAGKNIGIAPGAELVSAKIFHGDVLGNANERGEETTSALLAAIEYCVEQECDVINLSIGQYHNLVDDQRAAILDNFSINHNVIFCVAGGNAGYIPYCSGTIGNPGSSFQAITVAAYNTGTGRMASFSGSGPRSDYTMKPDISAPGVSINAPTKTGSYAGFSGTSAATPVVSGAVALLIHYLNENSLDYNAGTIKAAIINGAEELKAAGQPLPPDYQGAGLLDVENSWNVLSSAGSTGMEVDLLAKLPKQLPFRPFTALFTGESISFNATVISSRNVIATVIVEGLPPEFIAFPSTIELCDSTRLPVTFTIPETATPGQYSGNLTILYGSDINTSIFLDFELKKPQKRLLFDEKHTVLTYRPYTSIDSWGNTNFLSGMFREYAAALIAQDIAITPFQGGMITTSLLERYDGLILVNPCSWITDKYIDWVDPEQLTYNYAAIYTSEYEAIESFVKKQGGGLLVFTLGSETVNVKAVNELIQRFGITLTDSQSSNYALVEDFTSNISFLEGVTGYSHFGSTLKLTAGGENSFDVAHQETRLVAAGNYYNSSKGRVLVFSTDYLINNIGMFELLHPGSSNKLLAVQATEWVCESSGFEPPKNTGDNVIGLHFVFTLCFLFLTGSFLVIRKKLQFNGRKNSL
ncbi:MAG: S8 family serine peptidase [Candidatus Odinarchaeota archaeon]